MSRVVSAVDPDYTIDDDEIPTLRHRGYCMADRAAQICAWLACGETLTEDIIAIRLAIAKRTAHKLVASVSLAFPVYEDEDGSGRLRLVPLETRGPSS